MVTSRRGQATTELVILMTLLTFLGLYLMTMMIGNKHQPGAVQIMGQNGAQKIANDD